jgi:hypothetical protein
MDDEDVIGNLRSEMEVRGVVAVELDILVVFGWMDGWMDVWRGGWYEELC